uniref:acetolactate synthase small subunit n=1 Tax=Cecembia sp. TaxID=1898110 RepID=UPI0025B8B5A8
SRMTIVVRGDDQVLEQVVKQLNKLIDVVSIRELKPELSVYRELALIKVNTDEKTRASVLEVVEIFRGKVIDVVEKGYTLGDKVIRYAKVVTGA